MPRRRKRSTDWFSPRAYPHFDHPVSTRQKAEGVVASFCTAPRAYRFLPLISFYRWTRRWRINKAIGVPMESWKKRPLAYCSNRDAHVFAYVGWQLTQAYELALVRENLSEVVVGYRRGRSNVTTARDAFADVQRFGTCTTIALDLEGFFSNIPHVTLKRCWEDVLQTGLPDHHYAAFRALTQFSTVDRSQCLKRLGMSARTPSRKLQRPLCSLDDFRDKVRGRAGSYPHAGLVEVNTTQSGIPQGTPMSGIAANVAMLRFDRAMNAETRRIGGTYRRYSDDILLVCPPKTHSELLEFLRRSLEEHCAGLRINEEKTSLINFDAGRPAEGRPMQYLGFTFDGRRALLRPATISRFYGRMRRAVAAAEIKLAKGKFENSDKGGRPVLQRRKILRDFTHLGQDSLIRNYARVAATTFGRRAIMRQFRRHHRRLKELTR
jgi:RNA-directed DNA polymerase